ncbi:MAG: hypothetical protein IJY09_05310 [Lachnospiraceae bacterium]|nr:hypothetical protein [Lachnospiraceae bacterium]
MTWISRLMKRLPRKEVSPAELEPKKKQELKLEKLEKLAAVSKEQKQPVIDEEGRDENGEYELLEREILPEKIICPDCGGITLEGLEFCDKCGGELT